MNSHGSFPGTLRKIRWSEAPLGLTLFVLFSFGVSVFAIYYHYFASQEFHETVIPHIGWSGATRYWFLFIMGLSMILSPSSRERKYLIAVLAIFVLMGAVDWLQSGREDYGNPYLMYGWLRPIWDMMIPMIWILVLSSKSVRAFEKLST